RAAGSSTNSARISGSCSGRSPESSTHSASSTPGRSSPLPEIPASDHPVRETPTHDIHVSAAIIVDGEGRVLVVRKHGTTRFMQPGGKPEPGEIPAQTLARELD